MFFIRKDPINFSFIFLIKHLDLQEESEIPRHHEPSSQVILYPEYCPTTTRIFSEFGISIYLGGCKEEAGWKASHKAHPHCRGSQRGPLPGS